MKTTLVLLSILAGPAVHADYVSEFIDKTGLKVGHEYVTDPDNPKCLYGELTIEPQGPDAVVIRLGADILVMNVSEKPVPPDRDTNCKTEYATKTIARGVVDTIKTKRCPKVKGLEYIVYHTVIKATPKGFDYVITYEDGTRRECRMLRK